VDQDAHHKIILMIAFKAGKKFLCLLLEYGLLVRRPMKVHDLELLLDLAQQLFRAACGPEDHSPRSYQSEGPGLRPALFSFRSLR
jgi:hypothetical protein